MKKHYKTLGLQEGASQEEIQTAFERLSKELDPQKNDNQEFFKEEYQKVQEAYEALRNSSILATEKGAKQVFEKPNPSPKINSVSPKKSGTETPKKINVTKGIIFSIAVFSIAIIAYRIFDISGTYKRTEIVFNKDLAYLKKDMSLLNGKINYGFFSGFSGLFVDGKREGFHKIKYNYSSKEQYHSEYKWNRAKNEYTIENRAEGEFIDNKYNGEWTFYHYYGKVYAKGTFKNQDSIVIGSSGIPTGDREGLWRFWHENGQLIIEKNYVNGNLEGLYRSWHENGQLQEEGNYLNGEREGLHRFWHENGQLEQEGNYLNGKREGLHRFWRENGQLF
jgi:hypothetical protein